MAALQSVLREEALRVIPDTPATLELRDIALDPRAAIYRSGQGLLLAHAHGRLAGASGPVAPRDVDALLQGLDSECELLADTAAYERLRSTHPFERAIIQTLSRPWGNRQQGIGELIIRPLEPSDPLAHLPDELRREIESAQSLRSVVAGFIAGAAVSFAYWGSRTETYHDISIDTLKQHRNRGVGAAVVSALIDRIVAEGGVPVWGAVEGNHASLRLAEKLGFTRPAGEVFVYDLDRPA